MVSAPEPSLARLRRVAGAVPDPELPVLTIADLGILRDVRIVGGTAEIDITPTYSGCPAMAEIAAGIIRAVEAAGFGRPRVNTVLSPAWTTDFMTAAARRALREYGIAPPPEAAARRPRFAALPLPCPRCGSAETEELAPFGATACKALWRCHACREPFEHFKCH